MNGPILSPYNEACIGAGLISWCFWSKMLTDITTIGSAVAAITGAVVGIHAVYRIYKEWRNGRKHNR